MERFGLTLENYKTKITLEERFEKYTEPLLVNTPMKRTLSEITSYLIKNNEISNFPENSSVDQMRDLLYRYIITRIPKPLPENLHSKINLVMQKELLDKQITDEKSILVSFRIYGKEIKFWKGDITTLEVDSIVNAANNRLLGCFRPNHMCIDNVIHSKAGPQLRDDCNTIMKLQGYLEPTGTAKITKAYNLPSRYILHTVGPIWNPTTNQKTKNQFKRELANSYISCLNLASQIEDIHSIAFCCISTGEFGFPQELAAKIAFETVIKWCKTTPSGLKTIIFNVFLERDNILYKNLIYEFTTKSKNNV